MNATQDQKTAKTEFQKLTTEAKKRRWRSHIYGNNPALNSRIGDMIAYLMTHRFQDKTPNTDYGTSDKWVLRAESNSHIANADRETTKVFLNWYSKYNATVKRLIE